MRVLLIALAILAVSSIAHAGPSTAVSYLMSEPVTLFDWGIVRLYEYVNEFAAHYLQTGSVQDIYSTVSYDPPRNEIVISFVVTRKPDAKDVDPASGDVSSRNVCRSIIQKIRREFFADRNKEVRRSSGIYRFFAHVGFRGDREPLDCFEEIENITVIRVSVYSDKDPGKLVLQSESPLMAKDITFGGPK
jgi:hypothetical protein